MDTEFDILDKKFDVYGPLVKEYAITSMKYQNYRGDKTMNSYINFDTKLRSKKDQMYKVDYQRVKRDHLEFGLDKEHHLKNTLVHDKNTKNWLMSKWNKTSQKLDSVMRAESTFKDKESFRLKSGLLSRLTGEYEAKKGKQSVKLTNHYNNLMEKKNLFL